MQRVTITIDDDLLAALDSLAAERHYESRSEAVRDILRDALAARTGGAAETPCVATLSYVYDHHVRDLARRITRQQHEHHDLSVATLHVHLDGDRCLEVAVLKGGRGAVEAFADALASQRGVRYGQLHIIPPDDALV